MSLLDKDNLERHNELLPESVANEYCVLITGLSGGLIQIAHPASGWDEGNIRAVEYHLNRELAWTSYPVDEIEKAIRIAYGSIRPVEHCTWKFAYECPAKWDQLKKTDDDTIRNCSKCNKQVHLCFSGSQVAEHAKLGECVCLVNWVSGESIGDVRILTESELAELDPDSFPPTCPECEQPTQTKYGKQCFECGHTWH